MKPITTDPETIAALCGRLREDAPFVHGKRAADTIELLYADRLSFSRILADVRSRLNCPEGHDLIAWIVHLKVHDDALSKEYERLSREREAICAALGIAPTDDPVEAITADAEEKAHWIAEHERALADLERERNAHASTAAECRRLEERVVVLERERDDFRDALGDYAPRAWAMVTCAAQRGPDMVRDVVAKAHERDQLATLLGADGPDDVIAKLGNLDEALGGRGCDLVEVATERMAALAAAEKRAVALEAEVERLKKTIRQYEIDADEASGMDEEMHFLRRRVDCAEERIKFHQNRVVELEAGLTTMAASVSVLRDRAEKAEDLRPLAEWVDKATGRGENEGHVEACERLAERWRSESARSGAEVMHLRDTIEETHAILDPIVPRVRQGESLEYQARRAAGVVRALLAALMRAEEAAASARTVSAE